VTDPRKSPHIVIQLTNEFATPRAERIAASQQLRATSFGSTPIKRTSAHLFSSRLNVYSRPLSSSQSCTPALLSALSSSPSSRLLPPFLHRRPRASTVVSASRCQDQPRLLSTLATTSVACLSSAPSRTASWRATATPVEEATRLGRSLCYPTGCNTTN
jgi:hypothetical protein